MPKVANKQRSMALYESILELKDLDECCAFFYFLCTVGELRALEQRYDVAILLDEGMVYTDILEKTGASSATISRVNRIFSFGAGGFRRMIQRRKEKKERWAWTGKNSLPRCASAMRTIWTAAASGPR